MRRPANLSLWLCSATVLVCLVGSSTAQTTQTTGTVTDARGNTYRFDSTTHPAGGFTFRYNTMPSGLGAVLPDGADRDSNFERRAELERLQLQRQQLELERARFAAEEADRQRRREEERRLATQERARQEGVGQQPVQSGADLRKVQPAATEAVAKAEVDARRREAATALAEAQRTARAETTRETAAVARAREAQGAKVLATVRVGDTREAVVFVAGVPPVSVGEGGRETMLFGSVRVRLVDGKVTEVGSERR